MHEANIDIAVHPVRGDPFPHQVHHQRPVGLLGVVLDVGLLAGDAAVLDLDGVQHGGKGVAQTLHRGRGKRQALPAVQGVVVGGQVGVIVHPDAAGGDGHIHGKNPCGGVGKDAQVGREGGVIRPNGGIDRGKAFENLGFLGSGENGVDHKGKPPCGMMK